MVYAVACLLARPGVPNCQGRAVDARLAAGRELGAARSRTLSRLSRDSYRRLISPSARIDPDLGLKRLWPTGRPVAGSVHCLQVFGKGPTIRRTPPSSHSSQLLN